MDKNQLSILLAAMEQGTGADLVRLKNEWVEGVTSNPNNVLGVNAMVFQTAEFIMRLKEVQDSDRLRELEEILNKIVLLAVNSRFVYGLEAMRVIFNSKSEFYEYNNLDRALAYPIGRENPLPGFVPTINEECDVVRPNLSCTTVCTWSRCLFLGVNQHGVATVKFSNLNDMVSVRSIFAPLGSRSLDHDWRMSLNVGDLVDAQDDKLIWCLSTITQLIDNNGVKEVKVAFRFYHQQGDKKDQHGDYFGWGSGDQVLNVMSPRIQKPYKMHKKIDYNIPSTSVQFMVEDSYDILYEQDYKIKPFYAVLRTNYSKSQTLVTLFNTFMASGGMRILIDMMNNNENIEWIFNLLYGICSCFYLLPRMALPQTLSPLLSSLRLWTISNVKTLTAKHYELIFYSIIIITLRIMSYSEASLFLDDLKKQLFIHLISQNLDKQIVALRILFNLMKPAIPFTTESKRQFIAYLQQNNIFERVYQYGVHDQILPRTKDFLKFYLDSNILHFRELEHLWRVVSFSDLVGRAALQKLLGEVSQEMNHEEVEYLVAKILEIRETELTVGNLGLLKVLKDKVYSRISIMKMLEYLWDLITVKANIIKVAVESEAEIVFKGFIVSVIDPEIRFHLLKKMIKTLKESKSVQVQVEIIYDYLKTFKEVKGSEDSLHIPTTTHEIVGYLRETESIYLSIMGFIELSNSNPEQIKSLLKLLRYLVSVDTSVDSAVILRDLFFKLEDKQLVLKIAKQLASSSVTFAQWFFKEIAIIESLSKLSPQGFQSIKELFIELNTAYKSIQIKYGAFKEKEAVRTKFIYVMIEPYELVGMEFLDTLLKIAENTTTVQKIIEFLISLIVNLDQSLSGKIIEVRKTILKNIVNDIDNLSKSPFTERTISYMDRNLMIIEELFAETEKKGLFNLSPHLQSIEGEPFNLKIVNNIPNSKVTKEFSYVMNENSCLWRLQQQIAEILGESPMSIKIEKTSGTMVSHKLFGTPFSQLPIWRDQTLNVERNYGNEIPKESLVNQSGNSLSQPFQKLVVSWFNMYQQSEDALSAQGLHKFNNDFSRNPVQEKTTLDIIQKYDTNKDMILTLDQFKQYFYDRATTGLNGLWKFLNLNRYLNNLKKLAEQSQELTVESLPRFILCDDHVIQTFFAILKNPLLEPIHKRLYNLIMNLPTNKGIQKALESNYRVLNECSNIYQYNYLLDILIKKLKKLEYQFFTFAANKGVEFLLEKISSYDIEGGIHLLSQGDEIAVSKILNIVNLYFYVDQAENKVFNHLYNSKSSQKNLGEFKEWLGKEMPATSQSLLMKKKTLGDMNITLDYDKIIQIHQKLLRALIAKEADKAVNKTIVAEMFRLSYLIVSSNHSISIQPLISGILTSSLMIRRLVTNTLYLNTVFNAESQQAVTNILLSNIPSDKADVCTQFFDLLSTLIEKSIDKVNASTNLSGIVENIINSIISMKTEQKRNTYFCDNKILKGQLQLISAILKKKPEICHKMSKYKMILMRKCLFFYNPEERIKALKISKEQIDLKVQQQLFNDYPSCKTPSNRKSLYQIISLLQKSNPDPTFVEEYILPILDGLKFKVRKPAIKGYAVGLYNFGSTCYMNAMLQMLARVAPFRNGLLMADITESKVQVELQQLYSYLFYSERQDYAPQKLLTAFQPAINPMIQQDTTEFLSFLFNHIQKDLKDSPYRHLVDGCFQGTTVVQMICHNCGKKKQRDEAFYYYQVSVKDRNNLSQALQHNSQGEVINDWMCEFCNQKSDITKKTLLKQTPNVMFIHLQRIIFDLDRYMNTKIHTHLEFPEHLNIEPFIQEGIELRQSLGLEYIKSLSNNEEELKRFKERCLHGKKEEDYLLDLVGVIVHSGTADAGHYYSIAKQVVEKSPKAEEKKGEKEGVVEHNWVRLDDVNVSFCSKATLFSECFGGSFMGDWGFEHSKNAYVLVYEKRVKKPIQLVPELLTEADLNKFKNRPTSNLVDYSEFVTYNTEELYKQVWLDNHNLMVESQIFGQEYGKQFIDFLCNILEDSKEGCVGEVISQVLFKVIPHISHEGKLLEIFQKSTPDSSLLPKYLSDQKKLLQILFHNNITLRIAFSKYLSSLMISCLKNQHKQTSEKITTLIAFLISILNTEVAKNWIKSDGYFYLLFKIIYDSIAIDSLYLYLVSQELITKLIDFILGKDSPFKLEPKKYEIGNKHAYIDFTYGIHAIFVMIQRSYLFLNANVDGIEPRFLYHLSDRDSLALGNMEFYERMIRNKIAPEQLAGIIQRLAINNYQFSLHITKVLLTILNDSKGSEDIFNVVNFSIKSLLALQDVVAYQRIEMILGCGNQIQIKKDNRIYSTEEEIYSFVSTIENLPPVEPILAYIFSNKTLFPLIVFNLLRSVVAQSLKSKALLDFMAKQPAVNYHHSKYYEWIRHYAINLKSLLNMDKMNASVIDQQIQQVLMGVQVIEVYDQTNNLNPPPLISGSILDTHTEYRLEIAGFPGIFQQLIEYEVYGVESKPDNNGKNHAFGQNLSQHKIKNKVIDPSSNILFIMRQTVSTTKEKKSMKIQKVYAAEEESDIQPFFSDFEDIKQQPQSNVSAGETQENHIEQQNINSQTPLLLNIQNIVSNNYYRQIVIQNSSEEDIWVIVDFDNINPLETNCLLPSKCSSRVRAGYKEVMIVMSKFDYHKTWIQFSYRITIDRGDKYKERDTNIYSYRLYGELPKLVYDEEYVPTSTNQIPEPEKPQEQQMVPSMNQEDFTERPCPNCTYLNLSILSECEACGSPINF